MILFIALDLLGPVVAVLLADIQPQPHLKSDCCTPKALVGKLKPAA